MTIVKSGYLFESEEEWQKWDDFCDKRWREGNECKFKRFFKYGPGWLHGNVAYMNYHYCQLDKKLERRRAREARRAYVSLVADYLERSE